MYSTHGNSNCIHSSHSVHYIPITLAILVHMACHKQKLWYQIFSMNFWTFWRRQPILLFHKEKEEEREREKKKKEKEREREEREREREKERKKEKTTSSSSSESSVWLGHHGERGSWRQCSWGWYSYCSQVCQSQGCQEDWEDWEDWQEAWTHSLRTFIDKKPGRTQMKSF